MFVANIKDILAFFCGELFSQQRYTLIFLFKVGFDGFGENVIVYFFHWQFLQEGTFLVEGEDEVLLSELLIKFRGGDVLYFIDVLFFLAEEIIFPIFLVIKMLKELYSGHFRLQKDANTKFR